jgi:hypothetical protein
VVGWATSGTNDHTLALAALGKALRVTATARAGTPLGLIN